MRGAIKRAAGFASRCCEAVEKTGYRIGPVLGHWKEPRPQGKRKPRAAQRKEGIPSSQLSDYNMHCRGSAFFALGGVHGKLPTGKQASGFFGRWIVGPALTLRFQQRAEGWDQTGTQVSDSQEVLWHRLLRVSLEVLPSQQPQAGL